MRRQWPAESEVVMHPGACAGSGSKGVRIACGTAPYLAEWHKRGYRYCGLDLSPAMLENPQLYWLKPLVLEHIGTHPHVKFDLSAPNLVQQTGYTQASGGAINARQLVFHSTIRVV